MHAETALLLDQTRVSGGSDAGARRTRTTKSVSPEARARDERRITSSEGLDRMTVDGDVIRSLRADAGSGGDNCRR